MRKPLTIFAALLVLLLVNWGIWQKEQLVTNGKSVIVELAPVDPRSLMQGDYMALNFSLANNINKLVRKNAEQKKREGIVIVNLDQQQIATLARLDDGSALAENQIKLKYRIKNEQANLATNAFFFQEGQAHIFGQAKYGEFKVAEDGEAILVNMLDKNLLVLGKEAD